MMNPPSFSVKTQADRTCIAPAANGAAALTLRVVKRGVLLLQVSLVLALGPSCGVPKNPPPRSALESNVVRCDAYESCDIGHGCTNRVECIRLSGCLYPICLGSRSICQQVCGSDACAVKESAPAQMNSCPDGRPIRGG